MDIFMWILTAIFGVGILFIRRIGMSRLAGYILLAVCVVTFGLFLFIQLQPHLDPAWDGAVVAISLLVMLRISFWITRPMHKSRKDPER